MSPATGAARLTRLALRRDRLLVPAWVLGLSAFVASTTALFVADFRDRGHLVAETRLVATNAGMRLLGISSGPTVGGYMLHRELVTLVVLAALLGTLVVVRHTRQDEELTRTELMTSAVVGRYAALVAAVSTAVMAELALAAGLAAAVLVNGQPLGGSVLVGVSVGAVGLVFVGVTAVSVQLTTTARGASAISAGVLGVSFLLSGVGNMLGTVDATGTRVTSAWPAYLSPLGWAQQIRPFGGGRLWPVAACLALTVALLAVAAVLVSRRDLGRGLLPEHAGRSGAARSLLGTAGLAWRLQRGAFWGWAAGLAVFGLILGSLSGQMRDATGATAAWYTRMGGTSRVLDAYQTSIVQMAAMFVAMYVVQVLLRLHAEEAGGTLESVLAAGVSRTRWVVAGLTVAVGGAAVLVLVFASAMGLAAGEVVGDVPGSIGSLCAAALAQLPGLLVAGAVVVAAVALLPRAAVALSWTILVVWLVIGPMFGPGLGLPAWLQDLSPFTHLPQAPARAVAPGGLVVLGLVACAVLCGALVALRRRDIALPA